MSEDNKINISDSTWVNHNASEIIDYAPTISTRSNGAMGSGTVLVIENKYILDDLYANREPRLYEDYAPALRAERSGLKVIEETE